MKWRPGRKPPHSASRPATLARWDESGENAVPVAVVFENKYFLDRLYEAFLVRTVLQRGWNRLLELNDKYVVDGAVNGAGTSARWVSGQLRGIQNGQMQTYGLGIAAGGVIVVVAVFAANPL